MSEYPRPDKWNVSALSCLRGMGSYIDLHDERIVLDMACPFSRQ